MKRFLKIFLAVAIALVAVMIVRTLTYPFADVKTYAEPPAPHPEQFEKQVQQLSDGVKFQTISDSRPEQFSAFRDTLKRSYPLVFQNMEYQLIDGNAILLRWVGADADLKPILFNAHYDVVPVAGQTWNPPPFSGIIADGRMYGRGTLDDKGMLFSLLNAAESLMKSGFKPQRDIYFSFDYNEETRSDGAKAIAQYLSARGIQFDAIYDEGGSIYKMNIGGRPYAFAMVGVAEKGYLTVRITVHGAGGHSSMPSDNTALGNAAIIMNRLETNKMPARMTKESTDVLKSLGGTLGFGGRFVIANNKIFWPFVKNEVSKIPMANAMVRTTTALTQIAGGDADNVLPGTVTLTVNFRLAPGDSIDDVMQHIKEQTRGFDTEIEIVSGTPASKMSPTDAHGFDMIKKALAAVYPTANVVPFTLPGGTDSQNYGELGNPYRFWPVALTLAEADLMHNANENITLDNYARAIEYFKYIMQNYDAK